MVYPSSQLKWHHLACGIDEEVKLSANNFVLFTMMSL